MRSIVIAGDDLAPASGAARRFVQLPTDVSRSAAVGYERGFYRAPLGAGVTPARLLGGLAALLHRLTQQGTIAVDVGLTGGRWVAADLEVAGMSPLTVVVAGAAALLEGAGLATAAPPPDGAQAANVAVTFGSPALSIGDPAHAPAATAARDLHLYVVGEEAGAGLEVAYNARLFRPETIARFAAGLGALLAAAGPAPEAEVGRLPVLAATEAAAVAAAAEGGAFVASTTPVHRQFEARTAADPAATACAFRDQTLTYAALDARSNRLAQHLRAAGVGPGVPVAVCLPPSVEVPVSLLAIFKVGGVYLPLDPTHPASLIAMMLDEAEPRLVLTQSALAHLIAPDRFTPFYFDRDWAAVAAQPAVPPAGGGATLGDPAYLIYTSGTTGRPKGVLATQANLAYYIDSARAMYGFRPDDAFCALARYTFSISLWELMSPLCCGGRLRLLERDDILAPDRLTRVLEEVTVLHAGPSLLGSLFRHLRAGGGGPRSFPRMRHASSGGDLVAPNVLEEMKQVFPNAELFVIYGCTEVSCMGTTYPVSRAAPVTRSFVGRPFPGATARLLDPQRNLVPFGVTGEICFSGPGVVPGYLGRPELTAEKFVELDDGRRFYMTGDLGRLHADGQIEILGRRDFQVQVRGIRVELPGIENTIRELGLATQCAVVARKGDDGEVRLVAFLAGARDADVGGVRRALAARLPDYMLPNSVVAVEGLPLTPNGKLDRNRLQALAAEPTHPERAGAGAGAGGRELGERIIERRIAAEMAATLGLGSVGLDDDFFERGGDSLLAVSLLQRLQNKLGISVPPALLFEHSTVRGLAAYLEGKLSTETRPIPLNEAGEAPPVYLLLGVHIYRGLARRLEGAYAAYGVYAARELSMFEATDNPPGVAELAHEYVRIIRRQQPHGPYRLIGLSFGGIVAFEVAQQLRAAGEEVPFLGLLDAALPEQGLDRVLRVATNVRERVRHAVSQARHLLTSGSLPPAPAAAPAAEAPASPLDELRQGYYKQAAADYVARLRPLTGNVTLIVAGKRLVRESRARSETCGWAPWVDGLETHTLDADHLALLEDPKVSEVSAILLRALRRGDGQSA